jgi:hypothetical protein
MPLGLRNISGVAHTEMKFGIQIYHPKMYIQGGISASQTSLVNFYLEERLRYYKGRLRFST